MSYMNLSLLSFKKTQESSRVESDRGHNSPVFRFCPGRYFRSGPRSWLDSYDRKISKTTEKKTLQIGEIMWNLFEFTQSNVGLVTLQFSAEAAASDGDVEKPMKRFSGSISAGYVCVCVF